VFTRVEDRALVAATVYAVLTRRWPGRFGDTELTDRVELGGDGLGLDSIEIVELLLDCEERLGGSSDPDGLLESGAISIGRLIDHLARA
jgi:acyl carrier protein